ncbi:tetratricopeptide repeat protein, partial [Brucella melitensis]
MRLGSKHRPLYGLLLSLLAGIAISTSGALAKTTPDPVRAQVRAGSFAGAYLAGRTAESDDNLSAAVDFYRQAMAFDPNNSQIKQDLMLVLLTEGRFKDALPLAHELQNVTAIERFSRLALAIDAINRQQYRKVGPLLMFSLQSDMDRLLINLMNAWVKVGQGNPKEALADVQKMDGPEWYDLFRTYNAALIADLAGRKQEARDYYQQAIDDRRGGSAAPDTYERVVMAFAAFKLRQGDRAGAIKTLK